MAKGVNLPLFILSPLLIPLRLTLEGLMENGETIPRQKYRLLGKGGEFFDSVLPGTFGGHRRLKIYGQLDCWSANAHLKKGHYAQHRVFFADEATAIANGYRPCGHCMRERYREWKRGGELGTETYPWLVVPPDKK